MKNTKEGLYIGVKKTTPMIFDKYSEFAKFINVLSLGRLGAGTNNLYDKNEIKKDK